MGLLRTVLLAAVSGCALCTAVWADPPAATKAETTPVSRPPLDLAPPDVHRVLPKQDLEGPTLDIDEPEEPPPTISVESEHLSPFVPGGIAALWWGVTHPSQAWRIFTPVQ